MGAALALLLQFAPSIIQGLQAVFDQHKASIPPSAPGVPPVPVPSGADKMDAAAVALRAIFDKFLASGIIPAGTTLTDDALRGALEAVFQQLKGTGQLTQPASSSAMYLLQGGTITPLKLG